VLEENVIQQHFSQVKLLLTSTNLQESNMIIIDISDMVTEHSLEILKLFEEWKYKTMVPDIVHMMTSLSIHT
jgi:hypothetical protein